MFQIKVDVEGNEITDQAATAAVSEKKEKNQQFFISVLRNRSRIIWNRIHNSVILQAPKFFPNCLKTF
jgi:hypothetical protein